MERRPDITAVFTRSGRLAYGALKTLAEKIPQDVSVIGFDGEPFGEFFNFRGENREAERLG